jgi:hypothetical protein
VATLSRLLRHLSLKSLRQIISKATGEMTKDLRKVVEADEGASQLLRSLRDLIQNARQRSLRAVDAVQVQTCWEIGRHRPIEIRADIH